MPGYCTSKPSGGTFTRRPRRVPRLPSDEGTERQTTLKILVCHSEVTVKLHLKTLPAARGDFRKRGGVATRMSVQASVADKRITTTDTYNC
jgi:hypothetical protein